MSATPQDDPARVDIRRWQKYLANERAEAAIYRDLAGRRSGEERSILLALAAAEARHEEHWLALLGEHAHPHRRSDLRTRILGFLAKKFGSVFVLALAQRAESRSPYAADGDATPAMAADEKMHEEVIRGLAEQGRKRLSGTFRAAVFGANDGLVSNLALVIGVSASGVPTPVVLITGLAGLLAGALSMGAGEYVSVRSQRELLEASLPTLAAEKAITFLDVNANELALVYRARGMPEEEANAKAAETFARNSDPRAGSSEKSIKKMAPTDPHEAIGTGWRAAFSSFCFFASGAIIPVLPYLLGVEGVLAVVISAILVGAALLITGAVVGILSGASPLRRALRQLAIGYGAAATTYILGSLFGHTV